MIHLIGAGIGGLAAAIALRTAAAQRTRGVAGSLAGGSAALGAWTSASADARSGQNDIVLQLSERAPAVSEVGAGIQLGANATRCLAQWGCLDALREVAVSPECVQAIDARSGSVVGELPLLDFERRYGAPYLSVHRADLHQVLLARARALGIEPQWGTSFSGQTPDASSVLIGCDGVHSAVRHQFWPQRHHVQATGHWAWRALLPLHAVPASLRTRVSAWLGPRMHVVGYPVGSAASPGADQQYNCVVFTEARDAQATDASVLWSQPATRAELLHALAPAALRCPRLLAVLDALPEALTRWPVLAGRALRGVADMAQGRIALLGDAAHPMRPYLAQGAAMAIEDAAVLARCITAMGASETALRAYAQARWWRNARVQSRAQRNGHIFHASGPLAWARNTALRVQPSVMRYDWLYGYNLDT